jgi:virginiamycin B lyase
VNRILLLLTLLAALAPASAAAAPSLAGEFPPAGLSAEPRQLTLGPDGNVWVALSTDTRPIAKVEPNGTVTEYAAPGIRRPFGITTGPDGLLWVTQGDGVARFSPDAPTRAEPVPIAGLTSPQAITRGPDDNLWTASGENAFRIPPAAPDRATPFRVDGMSARGIASSADGNLYIADFGGRLIRLTTAGVPTPYTTGGGLQEVTAGLGTQVAFTQQGGVPNYIGMFQDGVLSPPAFVPGADPFGIALGLDQAYWAANAVRDSLSRVTQAGTVTTPISFSGGSRPEYLTAGAGGTLWVSLKTARRIALVTGLEAPPPPTSGGGTTPPTTTPPPVSPQPFPPGQAPIFSSFTVTRTTTVGRSARMSVKLAGASSATLRLAQRLPGRRGRSGRCVRPSRANRRGRRCTRYVVRASADAPARGGTIRATFSPALAVGAYRVTLTASNAVGTTTASRSFTVKRAEPEPEPEPERDRDEPPEDRAAERDEAPAADPRLATNHGAIVCIHGSGHGDDPRDARDARPARGTGA